MDGSGYPDGLRGEAIPLDSRIILIADAFEAMTSDRSYRKGPGRAYALKEIARFSGSQFDPGLAKALKKGDETVVAQNVTKKKEFMVKLPFSERQRAMLLAGGLLNLTRETNK